MSISGKFIALLIITLNNCVLLGQVSVTWNVPIPVAAASFGNTKPRLVLNASENPVVVFGKNNGELFLSRLNGTQFSNPIQLANSGVAYVTNWTSADIGSKGDTIMVVFKSYPLETGSMFLVRSFDGGATVQDILEIEHQQNGVAWLPSLEMDDLGNPHIIYMGHDQNWTNPHYYLLHSNDLGALFSVAQNITTSIPEEACDCCPAELVLSENKQVLLYRNNNQNLRDIFGVYSNDNGQNFSSSTNLESLDWLVMSCPSTAPDGIIIQDTLWSVSASKASGSYRIYLSKASLNSQIVPLYTDTLLGPSQQSGNQNHPRIKASSEYIAVTWHENAGTNYDVFVAVAPSNQPLALYDSKINVSENLSGNQIYSDVAVLGNKIHLVYQDNSTGSVIYRSGTINLTNQLNNTNQSMLTLLPNPVSDICNVSASSPIKRIRLFDQSGKYLATYHFNGKQATEQLHLHLLQAGSYFILIETNSGQEKLSFMKI